MPLPLIPLILGGAAVAAAGYGVKKGVDAYDDNEAAKRHIKKAKDELERSQRSYDEAKRQQENAFESLGRIKKEILEYNARRYMAIVKKLAIPASSDMAFYRDIVEKLKDMEVSFGEMSSALDDLFDGLAAGAVGGALAGFGAFGAVALFGTASTGTAIASLSGVAATNATLAFFGGGSLAAGGLGIAGGTAVLGGLIVAPVIFIAGIMMAEAAEENKREAKKCKHDAFELADVMNDVTQCSRRISEVAMHVCEALTYSNMQWGEYMDKIEIIICQKGADISKWNDADKEVLSEWQKLSILIYDYVRMPILNDDDPLTQRFTSLSKTLRSTAAEFERKYGA